MSKTNAEGVYDETDVRCDTPAFFKAVLHYS
jgi:hypothetical protein